MFFDLRALGYFVAAYEECSVTAAARRCHVAQPSISMAIKGLEEHLGATLFERSRRGLRPTLAGERLYPKATSLLAQSRAIEQSFEAQPTAALHLHIQADIHVRTAAPLLHLLKQKIPGLGVHIVSDIAHAHLRMTSEHCRQPNDVFSRLWSEPYVMLVPQSHALRFTGRFDLSDFHSMPLIDRPHCIHHDHFKRLLAEKGVVPDVRAAAQAEEHLLLLVELGLGLAVVPRSHALYAKGAVIRELDPAFPFERHVGLSCAPGDGVWMKTLRELTPALRNAAALAMSGASQGLE